jgi:hypothetical protein
MSYAEFCAGIAARDGHGCFIRRVLEARRDVQLRSTRRDRAVLPDGLLACDGQMDGHHVVAKQHIKREHGRAEFPLSVFAREVAMVPRLERDYPAREVAA